MLKKVEFEAKSLDEALEFAVEKLKIQKEKIKITVIKEKKRPFFFRKRTL
jgi:predicted RNA-binding protein Jag